MLEVMNKYIVTLFTRKARTRQHNITHNLKVSAIPLLNLQYNQHYQILGISGNIKSLYNKIGSSTYN